MAQSKTLLMKLWKKHITPLDKHHGGGASLLGLGYYYLDELKDIPTPSRRGETLFILHPGNKLINGVIVSQRDNGHWTVITMKSKGGLHLVYFDPAYSHNGLPDEIRHYLESAKDSMDNPIPYVIDQSSPQMKVHNKTKAFESCGLYCIKFLKNSYS